MQDLAEERKRLGKGNGMGRPARGGESPVPESLKAAPWTWNLSTARLEEPCRKQGRPRSKAKYDAATDSAQVP